MKRAVARAERRGATAFCKSIVSFCLHFFCFRFGDLKDLNVFAKASRTSERIEECAEQNGFKEIIEIGGKLPVSKQNEGGNDIDHGCRERDQGRYEIDGRCFSHGYHLRIVEKKEDQRTDGNVAKRMVEILVIIHGVRIGGKEECNAPDRRNERQDFFNLFKSGISGGVQNEIYGADEKQGLRGDLSVSEKRTILIFRHAFQIERNENADRKKDEAE